MRVKARRYNNTVIAMLLFGIILCEGACQKHEYEYPKYKQTMIEDNETKYYFWKDSGGYSFYGARWTLTETPKEGDIEETTNNEKKMSIFAVGGDIWRVTLQEASIEKDLQEQEYTWHSTYSFKSESDFSEETLVEEPHFHSNYRRSFYIITEHYATPEALKQIIENGEIICAGLNLGNVVYLDKAYIVYE